MYTCKTKQKLNKKTILFSCMIDIFIEGNNLNVYLFSFACLKISRGYAFAAAICLSSYTPIQPLKYHSTYGSYMNILCSFKCYIFIPLKKNRF